MRRMLLLRRLEKRGEKHLQELIATSGPYLSIDDVAKRLSITPAQVKDIIQDKQLLAIESSPGSELQIPAWQFDNDQILSDLPTVLQTYASANPLETLLFLQARAPEFDDLSPIDLLREGRLQDVLILCNTIGEHGGR